LSMNIKIQNFLLPICLFCLLCSSFLVTLQNADWSFRGLWLTPAQQFQVLFNHKKYIEAAQRSVDPMQQGTALYLVGQFKEAAAVFGTGSTAEMLFNRGNSLLMQGLYDAAVTSYQQAILLRPDWQEAIDNRNLAQLRKEKLAPPEDDYGGTGGKLEADEIVVGQRQIGNSADRMDVESKQSPLSKDEQRALWLRKVQTKPADFLRMKFAYQLHQAE